jgi:hypothetical protein
MAIPAGYEWSESEQDYILSPKGELGCATRTESEPKCPPCPPCPPGPSCQSGWPMPPCPFMYNLACKDCVADPNKLCKYHAGKMPYARWLSKLKRRAICARRDNGLYCGIHPSVFSSPEMMWKMIHRDYSIDPCILGQTSVDGIVMETVYRHFPKRSFAGIDERGKETVFEAVEVSEYVSEVQLCKPSDMTWDDWNSMTADD